MSKKQVFQFLDAPREMPAKVRTSTGTEIATSRAGDFVTLEEAMIVQADLPARNGTVHVIDRVLMPPVKK